MRVVAIALVFAVGLAGCDRHGGPAGMGPKNNGRYAGVGVFDAGRLWGEASGAPKPTDPAAATIRDDEHVIVVIDTHTGEFRQCGDHSGYCVTTNPWAGGGAAVPVKLGKHAADLDAEDQVETANAVAAKP